MRTTSITKRAAAAARIAIYDDLNRDRLGDLEDRADGIVARNRWHQVVGIFRTEAEATAAIKLMGGVS
jgi:hypothetical protein